MAKPHKLTELERVDGDLTKRLDALLREHDQRRAAEALGVSQASLSRWMQQRGYRLVQKWVREQ